MAFTYPLPAIIVGSVASSVGLIMVNKEVFDAGFPFVFSLSTMHFVVTFFLLNFMGRALGAFEVKYLPPAENFKVGFFGVLSICMMNFSLQYNSVGLYQVAKLCVIPCVMLMNVLVYGEVSASRKIKGALVLVILGVGMATVTDISVNMLGLMFAVAAVLSTSQFQIWQGKKQSEFQLSGMQCACSVAWVQMLTAGALAVILEAQKVSAALSSMEVEVGSGDNVRVIPSGSTMMYLLIISSCFLAVSVNVHGFLLIGKTSVVTYQVIGHAKTCLILAFGYVKLFADPEASLSSVLPNILSVMVALVGVFLYSNIKIMGSTPTNDAVDWCDRFTPGPCRAVLEVKDANAVRYAPVSATDEEFGELNGESDK